MRLTLKIDNLDALPDGGPLAYASTDRGFTIGREPALDWTLPDPSRRISSRHCDIRFEDGAFQLYDISSNGTFLNGAAQRIKSPYRLVDGDRLSIGHYVVAVGIVAEEAEDAGTPFSDGDSFWGDGPVLPPIDRASLMPPKARGRRDADFSEEFVDFRQFQPVQSPQPVPGEFAPGAAAGRQDIPPPAAGGASAFGGAAPYFAPEGQQGQGGAAEPSLPLESEPFGQPPVRPRPIQPLPMPRAPAAAPAAFGQAEEARHPAAYAPPVPRQAPVQPPRPGDEAILARIARGAGISVEVLNARDPGDVAEEIGQVLRLVVEELAELLKRRAAVKRMAKGSRTMVKLSDNNPLKSIPTPEEMLEIMFARRRGYMDAARTVNESFKDLKVHEFATFAAMQRALAQLLEDLSPDAVEKKVGSSAFALKKARAWDLFVAAWVAKAAPHENGMLDVFNTYFGDAYEKAVGNSSKKEP